MEEIRKHPECDKITSVGITRPFLSGSLHPPPRHLPPVIIDALVRTYPLLLKGARDHAPSHDVEHGDCENGQLRITRNARDRHCDHGRYYCDDDFGLDFGHGDDPPSGRGPAADAAGPRAPVSPVQRQLSRPIMAKGRLSLNSFADMRRPTSNDRDNPCCYFPCGLFGGSLCTNSGHRSSIKSRIELRNRKPSAGGSILPRALWHEQHVVRGRAGAPATLSLALHEDRSGTPSPPGRPVREERLQPSEVTP
jgi:hypothetical protein